LGKNYENKPISPQAVKRVMIYKADGGERPLGIPTVRDRIAQTVCKMILEPIFEADFEESSHGFRPGRSSKDAMKAIKTNLWQGKTEVYDADLSKYFDSIPHDKLQIVLKGRIADPRILKLIAKWLKVPVYEGGEYKSGKGKHKGTPQGGVISPLLANIYLHLIDRIVNNPQSLFGIKGIRIVRYADDFVLMGKTLPKKVIDKLKTLLDRMGYDKDLKGRKTRYWNIMPGKKSEQKIRDKIKEYLHTHGHCRAQDVANGINSITRGWLNYFEIKGVSYPAMSKRRLRYYLTGSLYRYYNRKSQRKCRLYGQNAFEVLVSKFGMIDPTKYALKLAYL
jgi:retron-type reverse transcriptase